MAMPIRSIPILEGQVWRRFEREARKAEKNRGSLKLSQQEIDNCRAMIKKGMASGFFK